jgi:hypothetical protein
VGLLKLGLIMDLEDDRRTIIRHNGKDESRINLGRFIKRALGRLLPGDEEEE